MVALPDSILSSLTRVTQQPHLAECILQPVDLAPDESPPWSGGAGSIGGALGGGGGGGAIKFQYWPESLQDSKGSEWNPRPVPGGSHPIYQWANGGERRLSFTAAFTTDTAPEESILEVLGPSDPYATVALNPFSGLVLGVRDLDIRTAVSWLRWFTYPTYGVDNNQRVYPPAKAILVMPNTALGHNGQDYITCAMTTCDVTYEAWFPTGYPRIVEVALEFAELVQGADGVRFHDRRNMELAKNVATYLNASHSV